MEFFINYTTLATGVWMIIMALILHTKNVTSAMAFKVTVKLVGWA